MTHDLEILADRVGRLTGREPRSWRAVDRGYTLAARYVVGFVDGSSAFVKAAVDRRTAAWLRREQRVYDRVDADFVPQRLAWEDGDAPLLVLEDLSDGVWTFSWSPDDIARTRRLLDRLAATVLPADFPSLSDDADEFQGWRSVAGDPAGFLSLGLASADWLSSAHPILVKAEQAIRLDGTALVHMDVRSDNLCFQGERTLLVDWNWARRGNPAYDQVFRLPSVHMEGGPAPWDITLAEPEIIAAAAGYFASRAPLPPDARPTGPAIRTLQRRQLASTLPWAARALGLPLPDCVLD